MVIFALLLNIAPPPSESASASLGILSMKISSTFLSQYSEIFSFVWDFLYFNFASEKESFLYLLSVVRCSFLLSRLLC